MRRGVVMMVMIDGSGRFEFWAGGHFDGGLPRGNGGFARWRRGGLVIVQ
jgi:hypothetical protein